MFICMHVSAQESESSRTENELDSGLQAPIGSSMLQPIADPWAPNAESEIFALPNGSVPTADGIWLSNLEVGYDDGFIIASQVANEVDTEDWPFSLLLNGWGQIRETYFDSENSNPNSNQFQLKRARLIFSGSAYSSDFKYFFQLDGRSSSGDDMRLLDYFLTYDIGHHAWGLERGTFEFRTGKYKMPFSMARYLSGREFEFTDRSMASMFFDVNRSLAWGLYGRYPRFRVPLNWEVAIFNGLVTGGSETGSSGSLDDNFAYSARISWYPTGEWGESEMADFTCHRNLASRVGAAVATSSINRMGSSEFNTVLVADSGETLASILPRRVFEYTVGLLSMDASFKYRGWSYNSELYFRWIDDFKGAQIDDLFDYGYWFQLGKFVIPEKLQLTARLSRIIGTSGTLGADHQSSSEYALGLAWYFRKQNAKLVFDATHLDGAAIDSSSLGINPGDTGWLARTQIQFAF